MTDERAHGAAYGLGAAVLFGISAPLAKLLLDGVGPVVLAGLLYLGSGLGLAGYEAARRGTKSPLSRADTPWLVGMVLAGGVAGPVLLLLGLQRTSGVAGALLLNLEAPLTILLAVAVFGEHLARREASGAALVILGAAALGGEVGPAEADWPGAALVGAACLCWAVDNNLTQRLSGRDPVALARLKGLAAGTCSLAIGLWAGEPPPPPLVVFAALVLGFLSYGASLVLHILAMRALGAARQAVFFATAPFAGAIAAVPLLGERPGWIHAAAGAAMAAGVALLVGTRHAHLHAHEELTHDHLHVHDEHHQHPHHGPVTEPHAHPHHHPALVHEHPHVSDLHHRHEHER